MRVLLTGANGFVGYYLQIALNSKDHQVIATSRAEMDFTDPFAVQDCFRAAKPQWVVHAGAMSKPDDCEQDPPKAYVVNVEGTLNLLQHSAEYNSRFILLSTDFVFNGEKGMYREEDERDPINVYGKTKMEAEDIVMAYANDWVIARTVMVYGHPVKGRGNILTTVREKLEKGEEYSVFDDQVRTPTYVEDLVKGVTAIIEKEKKGIFHLSGKDILTPWQMACLAADHLRLDKSLIKKIKAADLTQPAKRPAKTGFIIEKAEMELGYSPVSFMEGLAKTFPGD